MTALRTVAAPVQHADEPVKGSRFCGLARRVATDADALAVVDDARAAWPDATHHAWAYRLRSGAHRSHDAGEPGGSAGRPILAQIDGHDLTDVAVVVARWFGGTKLGVGGLIRAYGGCAGRTLDRAEVIEVIPEVTVVVRHAWDDTGPVQAVIGSMGLAVVDTRYDAEVRVVLRIPEPEVDEVRRALMDRTSGRVRWEPVTA